MKSTSQIIATLFLFSILTSSCEKKESKQNPPQTSNPTSPSNPSSASVMATANFNYLNDGGSYSFEGVNHILNSNGQAGIIIQDSTLDIKFKDKISNRFFNFRMEGQNMPVQIGTYNVSTPFNSSSPYRLSFASSGDALPLFFEANSQVGGQYYNNQLVVKYGELIITSITPTVISGTINVDLYSGNDYANNVVNFTNKLEVRNMSFSGTYQRVN